MSPSPPRRPSRRLVSVAGLLDVMRSVGLFGAIAPAGAMAEVVADDGQRIPVLTLGRGVPVVLLHGLGCSHRHWMPVARRLARHARVFAWDARGHGRCTVQPGRTLALGRLAADLHRVLDHFGLERAVLVGHSMGALTCLQYLSDFGRARVLALALVDQSPRVVTDEQWRLGLFGGCSPGMLTGLIAGARVDLAEVVAREVDTVTGGRLHPVARAALLRLLRRWLTGFDAGPLLDLAESLVQADFRSLVTRLDVPLWVVLGGRSAHYGGVPLEAYYRSAVPHAVIDMYARSGHSPHVAEATRFATDLRRFLSMHT
jgi:non-heme chloroperoxidase